MAPPPQSPDPARPTLLQSIALDAPPTAAPSAPPGVSPSEPDEEPARRLTRRERRRQSRRERRAARSPLNKGIRRAIMVVLVLAIATVGWSVGRAVTRPGNDPLQVKLVEWVRDHGGNGAVNRVESWWYSWHEPPKGGKPKHGIPTARGPVAVASEAPSTTTSTLPVLPTNIAPIAPQPLPGEGVWQPTGKLVRGRPAVFQTFLRPDPVHTSLLTGVAWMDEKLVRGALYNGLELPGGGPWQRGASIQPPDYPALVTAFNSGFKLDSSLGGYFTEGNEVRPLVAGRASLVVRTDGTVGVGVWGRDYVMSPDIASVRQNLDLLVDGGQNLAVNDVNDVQKWGATLGGKVYVWRSGVGVDRFGNLIYAGGNGLNITTLANVLIAAGAVRAMELDINSSWVSFYTFEGTTPDDIHGVKLLEDMQRPGNRFLTNGSRDFIAMFTR